MSNLPAKSSAQMTWFRLDPTRWLTDVRWMTPTTSHAFTIITMLALEREEPVPEDIRRLAKYAGMGQPSFQKALNELLDDGIVWRAKGGLMTAFVAQEVEHREQKRGKSKKAANTRWQENDVKSTNDESARNANGMPSEKKEHTPSVEEREGGIQPPNPSRASSTSMHHGSNGRHAPDGAPSYPDMYCGKDRFGVESFHGDRVQLRHTITGETCWKSIGECSTTPPVDDEDELDSEIPF